MPTHETQGSGAHSDLNEEATFGQVIDMVPVRVLSDDGYGTAIYVIDGDSDDATNKQPLKRTRPVLTVKRPGK